MSALSSRPPAWALVTGASAGIGEAFVRRLAREGYRVILVARRRQPLEGLAAELRRDGATAEVLVADLLDPDDLRHLEERIAATHSLALLINNAGSAASTQFVAEDPDAIEATLRLNVVAPTRLARAALPGMMERGHGAIVNVASVAAFRPRHTSGKFHFSTYGATKAYLVALSVRLQEELANTGIKVQALCPGFVRTDRNLPGHFGGIVPAEAYMEPADVVQASLVALDQGEVICVPGLENTALLELLDRVQDTISVQGAFHGTLAVRYRPEETSYPPE